MSTGSQGVLDSFENQPKPIKLFVSYSHKDERYLKEFSAHMYPLLRTKRARQWDDRAIDLGADWEETIYRELDAANIVICFVSSDFIASDFCYTKELARALDDHKLQKKLVIPLRLRSCFWDDLPLAKLQGLPKKWLTSYSNKDRAWTEVVANLRSLIMDFEQTL